MHRASSQAARYGAAILAVLLATLARWWIDTQLGDHLYFITYLVAVVVATWLGGTGPSLVTLVLGGILSTVLFTPEQKLVGLYGLEYQLGLALYLFIGGVAIGVNESLRRSRQRAEAAQHAAEASREELKTLNATLEQRVAERTAVAERRAKQLAALATQLARAEDQERRRLAQVLHDHLQQLLVGARLHLGRLHRHLQDERDRQAAGEIDGLLEQSIAESRSLTVELSPPVLSTAGLGAGLVWLGQQTHSKHGLEVAVHAQSEAEPIEASARTLLFQSVRELLFNAVKHAQATRAEVEMAWGSECLRIEVRDNGAGFDPARLSSDSHSDGFGLFSIRERMEAIGGRLEVDAAPGRGSRFVLNLPIDARKAMVAG